MEVWSGDASSEIMDASFSYALESTSTSLSSHVILLWSVLVGLDVGSRRE